MPSSGIELEQTPVSPQEAQAAVEAVLRSPQFERSERLQRFLRFICELTLQGESHRINEYLIGSEVFQRGADYSPSEDSIVRRQAHALRQKLHEYYQSDGSADTVRIELPVGRYVPVFRRAPATVPVPEIAAPAEPVVTPPSATTQPIAVPEPVPPAPAPPPPLPVAQPESRWSRSLIAAAILLVFGGLGAGYWMGSARPRSRAVSGDDSAIQEIWRPWLDAGSDVVICFSNPQTAVIKHYPKPLPPDGVPIRYRFHADDEKRLSEAFRLPPGQFLYYSAAINQTKVGEAIAGVNLASLLTRYNIPVRTTQSRFLSWEDLRKDNMVLMGHSEANQWLDPLLKTYPFRLVVTTDEHPRGIVNEHPAAGEPAEYKIAYSQNETEADKEYALISMIPGVEPGRRLLLINGLNSQATQIATEFMTEESSLAHLLGRLKQAAPTHTGAWSFQAVLRTEVYDKVPMHATLEALRVINDAPSQQ